MSIKPLNASQVRAEFWALHQDSKTVTKAKIRHYSGRGTMYNTDTRCAFNDFIDYLARENRITQVLAKKILL